MSDEHELTLTARGPARVVTTTETEVMTVESSALRDTTADLALDADRLYSSDIATTNRHGTTISTSDVASAVCSEVDATVADSDEWDVTITGTLDDWQKVALKTAKKRMRSENKRARLAVEMLLSVHKRHADTGRPLYAALNIDETHHVGCRDEILDRLVDDADQTAAEDDDE